MQHSTIKLSIPFESLVAAVADLSVEDKLVLARMLEEQLAQLRRKPGSNVLAPRQKSRNLALHTRRAIT
jgi:hypothetical protein